MTSADTGKDAKAVVVRHGARVLDMGLKHDGDRELRVWIGPLTTLIDTTATRLSTIRTELASGSLEKSKDRLGNRNITITGFRGGESPEKP